MSTQEAIFNQNISKLISVRTQKLVQEMNGVVFMCSSTNHMEVYGEQDYMPGKTIGFPVAGSPQATRGNHMEIDNLIEQRTLYIKADDDKNYFSVTYPIKATDKQFYFNNKKYYDDTVIVPSLIALKQRIECDGIQFLIQRSPIVPTYGVSWNQPLKPTTDFSWETEGYINKMIMDFLFPPTYKMILNTADRMSLINKTTHISSSDVLVTKAYKTGGLESEIGGLKHLCSPYLIEHITNLPPELSDDNSYTLAFESLPDSDERPYGKLFFASTVTVVFISLRVGDIIYHIPNPGNQIDDVNLTPLNWIQAGTRAAISDTRYAFVITDEAYTETFKSLVAQGKTTWKRFSLDHAAYNIRRNTSTMSITYMDNSGSLVEEYLDHISFSHRPVTSGNYQNCSRAITLTSHAAPDRFLVYGSHRKNLCVSPNFFMRHCFSIPPLENTRHSTIFDKKTGIKMLVTHASLLQDRTNLIDFSAFPCFGAIAQNLFTLPTSLSPGTVAVTLEGKKKK